MYKLLLVTDREEIQRLFREQIDWQRAGFRSPIIAASAQEGIDLINSKPIDAVGYSLRREDAMPLKRFLRYGRPSLPIYAVCASPEEQTQVLRELQAVLNRLHADFSDEYYDEEAMLTIQRDELVHALLSGELHDWEAVKRSFKLIRSHVSLDHPSILYEIDMPQGDVYLASHSGHAQQRLESALRNNFFGRYVDGIYYAVAVLTPRHIRIVCMPMHGKEPETIDALGAMTDAHVRDSILKIKEYLNLDLNVIQSAWLDSVQDLLCPPEEK